MNKLNRLLTRGLACLAAVGVGVLATTAATSRLAARDGDNEIEVHAMFTDASPLTPGNVVRASGVSVGSVESITVDHGLANVQMKVKGEVLPLHADARAVITEQDLLGERYVSLERGTASAPLLDGDPPVIPVARTARTVDLQTIFNGVDTPTGTALGALVATLGEGVDGRGKDIATGIQEFEPSLRQADQLATLLSDQNVVLTQLVDNAQPVLRALADGDGRKLDDFVGGADQSLTAIAANREVTREALKKLPDTLAAGQRTLAQVAGVADRATPTLAAMRPVTDDLTDISSELQRFSDAADPALASMRPVLERGKEMLDEARPVAEDLRPAGKDIRRTAAGAKPIMEKAVSGRLVDLMEFAKNWSLATSGYDGLSHYFRAMAVTSPKPLGRSLGGPVPGLPDTPVPGLVNPPDLGIPRPFGPDTHGALGGAKPNTPPGRDGSSATGMTRKQENSMLGQLLGGR